MQSLSAVWKPTSQEPQKKLADSCEISHVSLKGGAGAAVVSLYDGQDASCLNDQGNLKWVSDASAATPDNDDFAHPIVFRKGVFAVCEQGIGSNPIFCYAKAKYTV